MNHVKRILCCAMVVGAFFFSGCYNSTEVKIGVIVPREGTSLEDYGFQILSGIQMAHQRIKEATGEDKPKKNYQLIIENESDDIEEVKAAFTRLEKQGVTAIIGAASSAATLALSPMAGESEILLLSPASSSPEVNNDHTDYVYRNYPSDTLEAQSLSNTIFQKCFIKNILMVRARDAYSEGITYEMLKFARGYSKQLHNEVVKFTAGGGDGSYAAAVDRIVELKPRGIFLGSYLKDTVGMIKEIRSRPELTPENLYIFTCSSFLVHDAFRLADPSVFEGVFFSKYEWDPKLDRPELQEFARRFESEYHVEPSIYAATGYDAMMILVKAIDPANHQLADQVVSEMNKLKYDGLLGETDFNKKGDVTRIPEVYHIVNGQPQLLTDQDMEAIKNKVLTEI